MTIHLIGICGTGMGSLAGLLTDAGHEVRGSDENVFPPISTMLAERGIEVLEGYRASHLSGPGKRPDLVVVGNIATRTNPEVQATIAGGIEYLSMPQAIERFFLQSRHAIVVAGTHGKTSTTALIARLLLAAGRDPSFLVGGVLADLNASYRLGEGDPFVIEGDEYETAFFDKGPKFLHYRPTTAVLTSIEYDHAEMFPSLQDITRAFARLVALVPPAAGGGHLMVCSDDPLALETARECRGEVVTYGLDERARLRGEVVSAGAEGMEFRAVDGSEDLGHFKVCTTGNHNLRNALATMAVARSLGLATEEIRRGLESFAGVRRRQEVRGMINDIVVIDDFAHHPTAVRETIAATRARFAGRPLWAVFEPRTNTTRRDVFQNDYARAFGGADHAVIAPVDRPERAPAGQRLDVSKLVSEIKSGGVDAQTLPDVTAIVAMLAERTRRGDVVLIMSNGGFGGIHDKLLEALHSTQNGEVTTRAETQTQQS